MAHSSDYETVNMVANILDGRALSTLIKNDIKTKIAQRLEKGLQAPGLDVILIGENPASEVYVAHKQKACQQVGIISTLHRLPQSTTEQKLIDLIEQLNHDSNVNGILLQLPLPAHIDETQLLETISPHKDVDGFHPYNLGRLLQRQPALRPCTPHGVITLLEHYKIPLPGSHAVVVGASNIVGRPMALELLLKKATVSVCHRFTKNLQDFVTQADILVSATGHPNLINPHWIKPGATVVDVGITRLPNGKITGDIDFETAKKIAGWITPVPGGVGPMTVATLLQNTLQAADKAQHE